MAATTDLNRTICAISRLVLQAVPAGCVGLIQGQNRSRPSKLGGPVRVMSAILNGLDVDADRWRQNSISGRYAAGARFPEMGRHSP